MQWKLRQREGSNGVSRATRVFAELARLFADVQSLKVFVGGGTEESRYFGFEKAEVDGELAAVVGEMAKDGVGDRDASRILRYGIAAHFESPGLREMFVSGGLERAAGVGYGFIQAGEEVGFGRERLGAKFGTFRAIEVELVAIDDEGDPADHAGDYGSKVAELHGARVRFEVAVAFRDALDSFAGGGGFTVELSEEVVLEDHGVSP